MNDIQFLQNLIDSSHNIVFFGGAGMSTESGIPDFRSSDGLFSQKYKFPPEYMLSHSCFVNHTEEFFSFYKDKVLCLSAKPNAGHIKLAELEKAGKLKSVVTQNIDGLHQKAGSQNVFELHGSVLRNYCVNCGKFFGADYILNSAGIPRCSDCYGIVKPDVVLYEEPLSENIWENAYNAISACDLLIIGGTSFAVYPAAALVRYAKGKVAVINRDAIDLNRRVDLFIRGKTGEIFHKLK